MERTRVVDLKGTIDIADLPTETSAVGQDLPTVSDVPLISLTVEESFQDINDEDGNRILTDPQISQLMQIKLQNGNPFFGIGTEEDRFYIFSVGGDIVKYGFDIIYMDLINGTGKDESGKVKLFQNQLDYIFGISPYMSSARVKARKDSEIYRNKYEATEGSFKCRKCGSRETVSVERQLRSADEPATILITCVHCNNSWRA